MLPSNNQLAAEYLAGESGMDLARKYGTNGQRIYRALDDAGVPRRKKGPAPRSTEDIAAILALRADGFCYRDIGAQFGISAAAAWKLVKRWEGRLQ